MITIGMLMIMMMIIIMMLVISIYWIDWFQLQSIYSTQGQSTNCFNPLLKLSLRSWEISCCQSSIGLLPGPNLQTPAIEATHHGILHAPQPFQCSQVVHSVLRHCLLDDLADSSWLLRILLAVKPECQLTRPPILLIISNRRLSNEQIKIKRRAKSPGTHGCLAKQGRVARAI